VKGALLGRRQQAGAAEIERPGGKARIDRPAGRRHELRRERRHRAGDAGTMERAAERGAIADGGDQRKAGADRHRQRHCRGCQPGEGEDDPCATHVAAWRWHQRQPDEQRRQHHQQILPPGRRRQDRGDEAGEDHHVEQDPQRIAPPIARNEDQRQQGGAEREKLERVEAARP